GQLDLDAIRHAHLNIVLDPMFGVAQTSLQTILFGARCQVEVINARHDPLFSGRMPSPAEGSLSPLRQAVLYQGAALGIATDVDDIRNPHLNIVLDPMSDIAHTSLQTNLVSTRCQVELINARHAPLFGGRMPSPTEGSLSPLRQAVLDQGADLGIATDGDADRLGIIDDQGNYLSPNQVLVLLYEYLLTGKGWTGPVVRNLSTTHLLDRVAAAHGQTCHE